SRIVCVVRRRLCPSRAPAPPELHTLSLHDALPISRDTPTWSSGQISYRGTPQWSSGWTNSRGALKWSSGRTNSRGARQVVRWPDQVSGHHKVVQWLDQFPRRPKVRSEEHTSALQSRENIVCR